MLLHGLVTAEEFSLDECAEHAVVLLAEADRCLEVAGVGR